MPQEAFGGWRAHLGKAGGEQHAFEELTHPLQELIDVGPLQHIDLGGGPVRGLLAHRPGWGGAAGGWEGVGGEGTGARREAGPRACGLHSAAGATTTGENAHPPRRESK